jgi:hypothetical protein
MTNLITIKVIPFEEGLVNDRFGLKGFVQSLHVWIQGFLGSYQILKEFE